MNQPLDRAGLPMEMRRFRSPSSVAQKACRLSATYVVPDLGSHFWRAAFSAPGARSREGEIALNDAYQEVKQSVTLGRTEHLQNPLLTGERLWVKTAMQLLTTRR